MQIVRGTQSYKSPINWFLKELDSRLKKKTKGKTDQTAEMITFMGFWDIIGYIQGKGHWTLCILVNILKALPFTDPQGETCCRKN